MFTGNWYIFGAKSVAIGVIRAIKACHLDCNIMGVIVSSTEDNPANIEGYKVESVRDLVSRLTAEELEKTGILIATPAYVQEEIKGSLKNFGFINILALSSDLEEKLMSEYYKSIGMFPGIKDIEINGAVSLPTTTVLEVRHHLDQPLHSKCVNPPWVHGFQAGTGSNKRDISINGSKPEFFDNSAEDNIADKNPTYCELTAMYWGWKNIKVEECEYVGISQYRRFLDISEDDLKRAKENDVDVILPYPMLHVPNVYEHHTRYTNEAEWNELVKAIKELAPEYYKDLDRVWGSQYMYNYNMMIAKREVFDDFCNWLFPILFATEKNVEALGITPKKRYIAYFGESMTTLYFMHNAYRLKIAHTGRMLRE